MTFVKNTYTLNILFEIILKIIKTNLFSRCQENVENNFFVWWLQHTTHLESNCDVQTLMRTLVVA